MAKDESANRLLEWKSSDGELKSLIVVTDNDKHHKEFGHKRFELCEYDGEEWKTTEKLDYIDVITDFGIPEKFVD